MKQKFVSVPSIVLTLMSANTVNAHTAAGHGTCNLWRNAILSFLGGLNFNMSLKTLNSKLARGYTVRFISVFMLIYCNFFCLPKYLSRNLFWHSYLFIKPKAGRAVRTHIAGRPPAIFPSLPWGSHKDSSLSALSWLSCVAGQSCLEGQEQQELEKDHHSRTTDPTSPWLFRNTERRWHIQHHGTTSCRGEWLTARAAPGEPDSGWSLSAEASEVTRLYGVTCLSVRMK